MAKRWTADGLLQAVREFQPACVIMAAVELDIFTVLHNRPADAAGVASRIKSDPRAAAVLLDALAAINLLRKSGSIYEVPEEIGKLLVETGSQSVLGMARHQGNCLRRWSQLAKVVMTGKPIEDEVSVRGEEEDRISFIRAMDEISRPVASRLIESLGPLRFKHLLDLGGASGTYTIPFLRLEPDSRATVFDLPDAIPMAAERIKRAGLADRVRLVPGDFYTDALPAGSDLAWVSAIVHQNSREENRAMFRKVFAALVPGGCILIRDIVMDESRTFPPAGAFFAVNMLVATPGGGTFTFSELSADLEAAGFVDIRLLRSGEAMDSVVSANKPA